MFKCFYVKAFKDTMLNTHEELKIVILYPKTSFKCKLLVFKIFDLQFQIIIKFGATKPINMYIMAKNFPLVI